MPSKRVIHLFTLTMVNVAAISGLQNLPLLGEYGSTLLIFIGLAVLTFFVPAALVSAELATGWPRHGGVYLWVAEAFGKRWGFVAIWLQWLKNLFWTPIVLSFFAGILVYIFHLDVAENKTLIAAITLLAYWSSTVINILGMRPSGLLSSLGATLGILLPTALIMGVALFWLRDNSELLFHLSPTFRLPFDTLRNIAFLATVMLGLSGMEMSSVHATEVVHPQRNYPRAILFSAILMVFVVALGSLAFAILIPANGGMESSTNVLSSLAIALGEMQMSWLLPVVGVLFALGAIASVGTWISGPAKGLHAAALQGELPDFFRHANRKGMPVPILLLQGFVVSALCLAFLYMPDMSSAYWILTILTAQLYLLMYLLLFAAAIRLRYSHPGIERSYSIPGGKMGMWVVSGVGFLASLFGFISSYLPPPQLRPSNLLLFESFLILCLLFSVAAPFILATAEEQIHERR